ncbi:diguanylate cyclase [Butyrivibrio sp. CB08]|uniref:diguanylate cyclase n=1 Tax=Butyrivibrio sp. CB08 TaxID=2364879 RepID=UPI000EA8A626|nr:diguanylate cyclase [Butyrivibrio sp. CB08]RKM59966.1 diguanylate cyclase [Butyrivibrio sp. CB08]
MRKLRSWKSWGVILFCICINVLGRNLALKLELPIWLDAVGTIVAAIGYGPFVGAFCGVVANIIASAGDVMAFPYLLVSAGIGITVGLFYPRTNLSYLKCTSAAVLTGIVSALLSTPLNLIMYNGRTGNIWGDALMDMISLDIQVPLLTSFIGEAFVDIPDKTVSLLIAIAIKIFADRVLKILKKRGIVLALCICLLIPCFAINAQAYDFGAEYAGVLYDADSGLDSVEVNALAQTEDGYVWAGTYTGLYIYDGYRFRIMDIDDRIKNVTELLVDSRGRMWIGTNDNGVACYDVKSGDITFFTIEEGLSSNVIKTIAEDYEGNIYVGTATQLCMIGLDMSVESFGGNSYYGINKLASSGDTVAGIRSDGSIVVFSDKRLIYVLGGDFTTVAAESEGNYIVGSSTNFTGRLFFSEGKTDLMSKQYSDDLSYYNKILYSRDYKGAFLCCENGIGFLSDKGSLSTLTTDDFASSIVDVITDYQGNVWFASNKLGIKKYSWNPFEDIFARSDVPSNVVNSVLVWGGILYAGTSTGLVTIDLKTYYSVPIPHPEVLRNVLIKNIMCDSKDNIWFSTYGEAGVVKMRPDGSIVTFNQENKGAEGDVFNLTYELSDGQILAASNTGLSYIQGNAVVKTLGEYDGITEQILCIQEGAGGVIYAGSDGGGIYVIRNGELVATLDEEENLQTMVVLKIVPCKGGYIFVTSNALYYYNGQKIKRLDAFPYSNNYDVFISDAGKAWVLSSNGIYVIDEKDLLEDGEYNYLVLNRSRGLHTSITSGSNYVLSGDKLYLSCTNGVRRISTTDYDSFNNDYDIRLFELKAGDEVIQEKNGEYTIPATSSRIQFDVAVLNFSFSDPLLHIYLEGIEDEGIWCNQTDMRSLTFTNLPYGDYMLHVEVLDTSGTNVIREEVFPIHKESQLFERSYFKLYLAAVVAFLVMYIGWLISGILQNFSNVERLQEEATNDPLTGLYNKRGAKEILEPLCETETGILAIFDLDNFKSVNDIYGHDMGDRILIELSGILKRTSGEDDALCRTGGDEFVAFFKDLDEEGLKLKSKHYNEEILKVAHKIMGKDMAIPLGISIGAVEVNKDGEKETFELLFKKADRALYMVKNAGKHDCLLYNEDSLTAGSRYDTEYIMGLDELRKVISERGGSDTAYRAEGDKIFDVYRILVRMKQGGVSDAALLRYNIQGPVSGEIRSDVLEEFYDILKEVLGSTDIYSPDGHGNILVMMTGAGLEEANAAADRIMEKWNANPNSKDYTVTFEKEML